MIKMESYVDSNRKRVAAVHGHPNFISYYIYHACRFSLSAGAITHDQSANIGVER